MDNWLQRRGHQLLLTKVNNADTQVWYILFPFQCRKLGLLPPDEHLPNKARQLYQQMWANNGDAISRQYAGTAALKV